MSEKISSRGGKFFAYVDDVHRKLSWEVEIFCQTISYYDAESHIEWLRARFRKLSIDEEIGRFRVAVSAYDSGLATGFYGESSPISTGCRSILTQAECPMTGNVKYRDELLRISSKHFGIGKFHGERVHEISYDGKVNESEERSSLNKMLDEHFWR